jgi:hypothetical protein
MLSLLIHIVYLNLRIESSPGNKRLTFYRVFHSIIITSIDQLGHLIIISHHLPIVSHNHHLLA